MLARVHLAYVHMLVIANSVSVEFYSAEFRLCTCDFCIINNCTADCTKKKFIIIFIIIIMCQMYFETQFTKVHSGRFESFFFVLFCFNFIF